MAGCNLRFIRFKWLRCILQEDGEHCSQNELRYNREIRIIEFRIIEFRIIEHNCIIQQTVLSWLDMPEPEFTYYRDEYPLARRKLGIHPNIDGILRKIACLSST